MGEAHRESAGGSPRGYVYGVQPTLESIRSGQPIDHLTLRAGLTGDAAKTLTREARARGIPVRRVPAEWFGRFAARNHQGVAASLALVEYHAVESLVPYLYEQGRTPLLVLCDGITDVRNLGAIARTAECAGADGIVVPSRGAAQLNADAMRSSAGALAHLPLCRVGNIPWCIRFLRESGLKIVVASERGPQPYDELDLRGPLAIVLGDEGKGVSTQACQTADAHARIPVMGRVGSLNVSVAAGILLYEIARQRRAETRN